MRIAAMIAATGGLILAPAAQAASDPGLMLPPAQASAYRASASAGVQAAFTMPLGARTRGDGPRLSLRAGPGMIRQSGVGRPVRAQIAPLAEFAVRPGHSTTFSLARVPIAQSYTLAALRDEQARRAPAGGKAVSTWGAIGIGVGVLVVAAGVGLLVLIDEIEDNSE